MDSLATVAAVAGVLVFIGHIVIKLHRLFSEPVPPPGEAPAEVYSPERYARPVRFQRARNWLAARVDGFAARRSRIGPSGDEGSAEDLGDIDWSLDAWDFGGGADGAGGDAGGSGGDGGGGGAD